MFYYSKNSLEKLETCHPDLITLFKEVIKGYDCTILEGHRSKERQQQLFRENKTKIDGVIRLSKHQYKESLAVDACPYPIDWKKLDKGDRFEYYRFYHFVGYVKATADRLYREGKMTHKIRCGADWDGDNSFTDQNFHDLPHFELVS